MRLNQVTLPMTDYAASVAWWQRFGLKLIVDSPPKYSRFECPVIEGEEPSTLSLHLCEAMPAADWPAVYFEVKDIDIEVGGRCMAGIHPLGEPEYQSWRWTEVWFRDPAGNRVCLYTAGRNRRFPPWRVTDAEAL
jgi:catechol 2,3-dioxygenase-like lactoylglutathione lyase family enzyme